MPNYQTHKKIGVTFSIVISLIIAIFILHKLSIDGWNLLLVPLIIVFYSNLPDLDHHMSKLRKISLKIVFYAMIFSGVIFYLISPGLAILALFLTGLFGLFILSVPHRGPMHKFIFVLIASFPWLFVNWFLFVLALLCSSLHIFVDNVYSRLKRMVRKLFGIEHKTYNINIRL